MSPLQGHWRKLTARIHKSSVLIICHSHAGDRDSGPSGHRGLIQAISSPPAASSLPSCKLLQGGEGVLQVRDR